MGLNFAWGMDVYMIFAKLLRVITVKSNNNGNVRFLG
jgi:hypothetical protein